MRGWTFIDDATPSDHYDENGELTLKGKIREEMINKLASQWNEIHNKMERDSFRSEEDRDNEADYLACRAEEEEDSAVEEALKKNPNLSMEEQNSVREEASRKFYKAQQDKDQEDILRKDTLEELLADLGVRMMRPYEHWNEDERYMEYMETRYDDERW